MLRTKNVLYVKVTAVWFTLTCSPRVKDTNTRTESRTRLVSRIHVPGVTQSRHRSKFSSKIVPPFNSVVNRLGRVSLPSRVTKVVTGPQLTHRYDPDTVGYVGVEFYGRGTVK